MRAATSCRLLAAALPLLPLALPAAGQQGVSIQILNIGQQTAEVRVLDLVCNQELFAGAILDASSIQVSACADAQGLAAIRVQGRLGGERSFTGLADPAEVQFDFSPPP